MRVKPTDPNAVIRDPITRMPLPPEGAEVPDNLFWQRRLTWDARNGRKPVIVLVENAPAQPVVMPAAPARS